MSPISQTKSSASKSDALLTELIDEVSAQLEAGEPVDLDAFIAAHPERAEALRKVLPALAVLADLGRSAAVDLDRGLALPRPDAESLGELGDYRILREIGRGGMGVVYEATQISLNRRVALKVLPFAGALDAQHLARFRLEAQAAAQLHHTNIVPVFAVGTERGVHYYAMQFIEGKTVAALIRELRAQSGLPARGESEPANEVKTASTLAVDLISGRFDPAEPLPVRRGSPDPADSPVRRGSHDPADPQDRRSPAPVPAPASAGYGDLRSARWRGRETRAKQKSDTSPTRDRAFFRTVANLGLQAAEALEYAHRFGILHRDIKPANLLIDVRGNLWVTDFGLARFGDDASLTMTGDLLGTLRYMSPEQALGHPAVIDQRSDVYGLGVTLYELLTLQPAFDGRDRQEILRRIAFEEPRSLRKLNPSVPRELETIVLKAMDKEPAGRYATAQDLADDLRRYLQEKPICAKRASLVERAARWAHRHRMVVTTAFLFLLLAVLTLATSTALITRQQREVEKQRDEARRAVDEMYTEVASQWLAQRAALEPMQARFLQRALEYYQRFGGEKSTDPGVRMKTAAAYHRVGTIREKLGQYSEAEEAYRRALSVLEHLIADAPLVSDYRRELARTQSNLGDMLKKTGQHAEGERLLRSAIALGEKLAVESPSVAEFHGGLAMSYGMLGTLLLANGRTAEAEQAFRRAIELQDKLVADSPSVLEHRGGLSNSLTNLGTLLEATGRLGEAEQAYGKAIALGESLVADPRAVPEYRANLANRHHDLGQLLYRKGEYIDAKQSYGRSIKLLEKLVSDSPSVPQYRADLASSRNGLAVVYLIEGSEEAAETFRQAIDQLGRLAAEFPSVHEYQNDLAMSQGNLGVALKRSRHYIEAQQAYRSSIATNEKLAGDAPSVPRYRSDLASCWDNLGNLLRTTGHPIDAEQAHRQAVALFEKLVADSPTVLEYQSGLAESNAHLAMVFLATGRRAEQDYRRAIAPAGKVTDPEAQNELAWALVASPSPQLLDSQLALRLAKNAVEQQPQAGDYWNTLGAAHYRVGDWNAAVRTLEKSMQLRSGGDPSDWSFLAMACWRRGEKDQARKWYNKAADWIKGKNSQDDGLHGLNNEAAVLLGLSNLPEPTGKKEEAPKQPTKP